MSVRAALVLAVALGFAPGARAETLRLAVIVGNNLGSSGPDRLAYAETDASKVASVLTDLGNISPTDLYLLQGRPVASLEAAFDRVKERISDLHRKPGARALLVFFFSGHSDGEALQLASDRLSFSTLRKELAATGADVRVAIVDSCRSGALLAAKSGIRRPPFEVRLADDLPTQGTVLLTSSAADEDALESKDLRGSFFTSNLVSGLRGAADASGDGRITLSEAYQYAYTHTVAGTAQLDVGPQHPEYDMRLSGMGELVLTELTPLSAVLELPTGFERALVLEPFRDEVLAEVSAGGAGRIALPPGDYQVRVWKAGQLFAGRVLVRPGTSSRLAWRDLKPMSSPTAGAAKGESSLAVAPLYEAIVAFENLKDERAAELLRDLLQRGPPSSVQAKAHLYLGLIALNAAHIDEARAELAQALQANAMVELPAYASPKAQLIFGEVKVQRQQDIARALALHPEAGGSAVPAAVPPAAISQSATPQAPARSVHAWSWVLAAVGVAAMAAGIYGAVDLANYKSTSQTPGGSSFSQLQSARSGALFWADAWIPFVAGGALAGGGAVLAW